MFRRFLLPAFLIGALIAPIAAHAQTTDKDPPPFDLKRRGDLTAEDLRKQLQFVQELGLDQGGAANLYAPIKKAGDKVQNLPPDLGPKHFGQMAAQFQRTDQLALPWRIGADCEMGKEAAERLHVLSNKLRDSLRKSVPTGDIRPDPDKLRGLLDGGEWHTAEAIPTLTQMMQAENTPIRLLLVEMLGNIKGKAASMALANRAVFDLAPEVRQKAVATLAKRPRAEFQPVLYYGLRYPWAAAADHAAETIAALHMTDLVSSLVDLLKESSPNLPFKNDNKVYVIREVVRINHLSNCMVCHSPSLAKGDLVRGRVPMPGEDPPPLYYQERTGIFVRADITFLRQDFSVVQPVPNSGKWPGNQRYDYVLRERPLTKPEQKAFQQLEKDQKLPKAYPQRDAVLFALRQLTQRDAGDTYDEWRADLPKLLKALKVEKN
jgi:HEAT repeats